jgi:hypothetical protein
LGFLAERLPLRHDQDLVAHGGGWRGRDGAVHRPAVPGLDAVGAELGGDVHFWFNTPSWHLLGFSSY